MFLRRFFGLGKTNKTKAKLSPTDRSRIEESWAKIEQLQAVGKPSSLREAVIEADKLVSYTLEKKYPETESSLERLKAAKEMFRYNRNDYENLWYAHKLRNEIVHRVGFELPVSEAKEIIKYLKSALDTIILG